MRRQANKGGLMYPRKTGKMVDMQIALHEARERGVRRAVGLEDTGLIESSKEEVPTEKVNKGKKKKQ
jgi:hypothetical protein